MANGTALRLNILQRLSSLDGCVGCVEMANPAKGQRLRSIYERIRE
jgi:hypothetical protein